MKIGRKINVVGIVLLAVWCLGLLANASLAAGSPERLRELSPAELQKIESAVPAKAAAEPKQPRKILVFWLCNGYFHKAIPVGNKAFEMMGAKTGAYKTVVSNDMTMFEADKLKQFDAVLFNNTTKLDFKNPEYRKALMDFVKAGKGIVGIHAATDNFYDWPQAAEMMGALFDSHPWGAKGSWAVKLDEPEHPLNKAFGGKGFLITDEIYQFKGPYCRDKLRVLLSLDMSDQRNLKIEDSGSSGKIHREDNDYAITWIRKFGHGRVFYCSLGHNNAIFWNPAVLQHCLDGIQFALGDLAVDATPSALSIETIEKILPEISDYDYGHSREPLTRISDFVRNAGDCGELTKAIEQQFLKFLRSDASLAARQFICKELAVVGTEAAVPTLAEMLTDEKTSDMARYALQQIPGAAVGDVLRKALLKTSGKTRIGIINTLGARGDRRAVTLIRGLMYDSDEGTATAAVAALGRIGDRRAAEALAEASRRTKGNLQLLVFDAYLKCADRLADEGKQTKAFAIYEHLYTSVVAERIRIAALRGMITTAGEKATDIVVDVLKGDDRPMQTVAISLVRQIPGVEIIKAVCAQLPTLAAEQQVQILSALADRGQAEALRTVVKATESSEESVRIAALTALTSLGDESTVELLARTAAGTRGAEQQAARNSLYRLRGRKVQHTIAAAIADAEPKVKVELIRSTEERRMYAAAEILLKTAKDTDSKVRTESIKVLKTIGTQLHLPKLVDILINAKSRAERTEAEKTVVAVSRKIADPQHRADAVWARLLTGIDDVEVRSSLLQVLGKIGGDRALGALRKALEDKNPQVQIAAVRGLSNWPGPEPADDLLKVAQTSENEIQRVLALRGFIALTGLDSNRPDNQIKMYKQAMALASNVNEKKMALAGLANVKTFDALQMAADYLDVSGLREEAAAAVVKIADGLDANPQQTRTVQSVLEKVIEVSKSESLRKRALRVKNKL